MVQRSIFCSFILPQYVVGVKDKFINMLMKFFVDDFFANLAFRLIFPIFS